MSAHCLENPRRLGADSLYFVPWESSVTAPLCRYRWRGALWHCLWPLSPLVVMCKTAPPARRCSEEPCCLLGEVSGRWLLSDLGRLSITSIMKVGLPLQLPLNGKRCTAVCLRLWFATLAGIWSLARFLFWWPGHPREPAIVAQNLRAQVHPHPFFPPCLIWRSLIGLSEWVGGTFKTHLTARPWPNVEN